MPTLRAAGFCLALLTTGCGVGSGSGAPDAGSGDATTAALLGHEPAWAFEGDCPPAILHADGNLIAQDVPASVSAQWIVGVAGIAHHQLEAQSAQRCAIRASVEMGMRFRSSQWADNSFVVEGTRLEAAELARRGDVVRVESNGPTSAP